MEAPAAAAAAAPAPPTLVTVPVDTRCVQERITLLRLPEALSEVWAQASHEHPIGTLHVHQPKPGARPDAPAAISLVVDPRLLAKLTPEQRAITPASYSVNLSKPGTGARLFSSGPDGKTAVSLDGLIASSGYLRPYAGKEYTARMRKLKRKAEHNYESRDRRTKARASAVRGLGRTTGFAIDKDAQEEADRLPKFKDVFEAFHAERFWTMKDLATRVLMREADIRAKLREVAIYHKQGEYRMHYELKPEYLGTDHPDPVADEDDDI